MEGRLVQLHVSCKICKQRKLHLDIQNQNPIIPDGICRLLPCFSIAVGNDNRRSRPGKAPGDGKTDSPVAAGYNCNLNILKIC